MIGEPGGGPPRLQSGAAIVGYPSDTVAQLSLPGGGHSAIESLLPMAVEVGPGQRAPIDLSLTEVGGALEPRSPAVAVVIPKRLAAGIALAGVGVSLTPLGAEGAPVGGGEAVVDGAVALFANTQVDTDTVVKPVTLGFDVDTLLRSAESPQQLSFGVGMPAGAHLLSESDGSVRVVDEGETLATIASPQARDAAGTQVPVQMGVSGATLTLSVADHAGSYQYPIEVDPYIYTVADKELGGVSRPTHWKFCTSLSSRCEHSESPFASSGWGSSSLSDDAIGTYSTGQSAYFVYQAEGDSHVYGATLKASASDKGANIETYLQLAGPGGVENTLPWEESRAAGEVCAYVKVSSETCHGQNEKPEYEYGVAGNWVHFEQSAYGSGSSFTNTISEADVSVAQEGNPEYSFNTTEEHLAGAGGRTNVLYGKGSWLSLYSGAFELKFHDPGVGISQLEMQTLGGSWLVRHKFFEEGKCSGVFCAPTDDEDVTYNAGMSDGEDIVVTSAQDTVGKTAEPVGPGSETIKVDGTAPHGLALTGLPASGEIDEEPYALEAEATDGSGKVKSSGVASLKLAMDGQEITGGTAGTCEPGPCTVHGKWTINGESFASGEHILMVIATDYAGNVEVGEYPVIVHRASSVGFGPGSVNLTTGEMGLSATDASVADGGGALAVSRSFSSRHLTAGAEGPLGPQWSLSLAGEEKLKELPDGSMVLVGSNNGATVFAVSGGGFKAPPGDKNLSLSKVTEAGKTKELLLKDPAQSTTTRFTAPEGAPSGSWFPTADEGAAAADTVTYIDQSAEVEGKKIRLSCHGCR